MAAQQQGHLRLPQFSYLATLKKMAAAGCAASVAEVVSLPMDTTKVRLQIQGESCAGTSPHQLKYHGMTSTITTIIKEEGIASLFRGLVPGIHRQICFCGIRIGLYDNVRKLYGDTSEGKPKVIVKVLASCTTATTAVLLFQPTEVVKIRMQAAGAKQVYNGAAEAYATIGRTEGIKGLWRGYQTNIFRLSVVNCTEIVVYDVIKSYVLYKQLMEDTIYLHMTSAVGAGVVSCLVTSPCDVVKTRYINSVRGTYRSPIHCAMDVVKCNGPAAFYKGIVPSMLRFSSWAVVFFLSYEQIKRATGSNV